MITISLCMIVKNEEDVIERCLNSVSDIVDEIIVIDTGSTDKTKEIVKKFTDKIYNFVWVDDFSKARNYSFSKATKEYIMWLDADDILLEEDRKKLKNLKNDLNKNVDIVMMKYNVGFDENKNVTLSYYRERLLKKSVNYKWVGPIHEVISPIGNVIYNDICVCHKKLHENDPLRNIRIFEKMIKDGVELDSRQKFYYSRELYYNKRYEEAIIEFELFLDSKQGWLENCINACIDLSHCYKFTNNNYGVISSLLRSFEFDKPRAEVCCEIGNYFLSLNQYKTSIFWYNLATTIVPNTENGGFCLLDSYDFLPYIQLCVCYDKLKEYKIANKYNEKAGKIKPNDKSYILNKEYFKNLEDIKLTNDIKNN